MRGLALAAILAALSATLPARAADIWFAPGDDLRRGPQHDIVNNQDFPHLFDADPAWSAKIDVFLISPEMAAEGPEDELLRIAAFLKARRIKLGAEVDAMLLDGRTPSERLCGSGVEGGKPAGQNAAIFRRLKRLGLDIAYVAMDEPLTYGHYYQGKQACRYAITDVARRVAGALAEIKQSYPDILVEDDEAPQPVPVEQWRADFEAWLRAYREAVGAPLDSVVFDSDLSREWRARVAAGVEAARRQRVRTGMYLINLTRSASDAEAVAGYERGAASIDASRLAFDIIKIANWTPRPFVNLPQSSPTSLTYVLDRWNRAHDRR